MMKINLTKGKVALVDDDVYPLLNKFKWHYLGCGYAARRDYPSRKYIYMHRFLVGAINGEEVDHINGNGLDNRISNLRIVNRSLNMANTNLRKTNTSGFKGVSFDKHRKKWSAEITVNYKRIHLGRFNDIIDATKAYDIAAGKYFGAYSKPNRTLTAW